MERERERKREREERRKDEEERMTAGKKREGEAQREDKRHRRGILSSRRLVRPPFNGDSRGTEGVQDLVSAESPTISCKNRKYFCPPIWLAVRREGQGEGVVATGLSL